MEEVSDHLAQALLKEREDFNARFIKVRHYNRRLSPEAFNEVLRYRVAPVIEAVALIAPERLGLVLSTLYDSSLQLTALDLLGPDSRMDAMDRAFMELMPSAAHLIASYPARMVPILANAVYNLAMEPSADTQSWIDLMIQLGPLGPTVDQYQDAGKVAAWRCGMAHYRQGALVAAARLPTEILQLLFDSKEEGLLSALKEPWWQPSDSKKPARRLRIVARAGGFTGYGGPFSDPPEAASFNGRLYAFDRQFAWRIFADSFGVMLRRYGTGLPEGEPESLHGVNLDSKGQVSWHEHRAQFPELADHSSLAVSEQTLVVTLPHSHQLFLVALA